MFCGPCEVKSWGLACGGCEKRDLGDGGGASGVRFETVGAIINDWRPKTGYVLLPLARGGLLCGRGCAMSMQVLLILTGALIMSLILVAVGQRERRSRRFCRRCRHANASDARFCALCGGGMS